MLLENLAAHLALEPSIRWQTKAKVALQSVSHYSHGAALKRHLRGEVEARFGASQAVTPKLLAFAD